MNKFDVLIVGNYNVGNYGDDLLLKSCKQNLKDKSYKVLSPENSDFCTFPAGIRSMLSFDRYIQPFKAVKLCKTVLFGGGGIFNSDKLQSFIIWMPILILALLLKKKVYVFGHSFSSKPGFLFTKILSKVDLITVRDFKSYEFLNLAGLKNIQQSKDLALELNFPKIEFEEPKYLLINYRTYKDIDLNKIKKIDEILSMKAKNLGLKKLYCAFDSKLDSEVFKSLGEDYLLAHELNNILPKVKYFACMRLHACLFCLKNKIPGLALSYASKVKGLFNTFNFENVVDLQSSDIKTLENFNFNSQLVDFKDIPGNPWEKLK